MLDATTLTGELGRHAGDESTMLIHCGRRVSFDQLHFASRRVAAGLQALGVSPGDRVAIWIPTTPAWLEVFFACAQLGAIAVAVNTRFVARELADVIIRSGANILVCWPGFPKVDFAKILAESELASICGIKALIVYEEPDDVERELPRTWPIVQYGSMLGRPPLTEDHSTTQSPCLILTTSGTTKAPKFVLHGQQGLLGHARDVVKAHRLHSRSVVLLAPPLCGAFGICVEMAAFVAARPLVTAPTWDPAQAARWIDEFAITHAPAVDDAIAQLLEQNARTPAFPTLEFCGFGAFNPARRDIVERAQERGLCVVGMYGTSEIQGLFARQPESASAGVRALAGGRPVSASAQVRVRDPETAQLLQSGCRGELEIFAPSSRMLGYFGDTEATRSAFTEDGWYKTGDLGYREEDGSFVFVTRLHDTLRLGGFLVSPLEIESVIQECAGVELCQVVDVNVSGVSRAVAFVKMLAGAALDEASLRDHASSRLAHYKVPVRVFSIESFPITEGTNGNKIQKGKLREIARNLIEGHSRGVMT